MRHYVGMGEDLDDRLRAATTSVDMDKLLDLGCALADSDRLPDAEACFRRASDLGSPAAAFNLGNSLAAQECWLEAVASFELALERGENDAWLNLGLVLHELGDLAGEIRAYEQAEDAGDSGGPLGLAFALREQGDRETAMAAAQRSASAGNETAAAVVACWQPTRQIDPPPDGDQWRLGSGRAQRSDPRQLAVRGIGIVGYAAVFPVAALLLAILFYRARPAEAPALDRPAVPMATLAPPRS